MLPNDLLPLENFWKLKKRNSNNNTNVKKHKQNQNSTEFLKTFTHSECRFTHAKRVCDMVKTHSQTRIQKMAFGLDAML